MIPPLSLTQTLIAADASFNAMVVSQVVVDVLRQNPGVTMAAVEARLRALGLGTYLVAVPSENCPAHLVAVDPVTGSASDYYVHVCLHGSEEAARVREGYGILSEEANLVALERCGVLTRPN